MRVDPLDDQPRQMLRLQRESAVDAQHQGRGRADQVRIGFRAARRPVQPLEASEAGDVEPDDLRPMRNQADLAQAARGERRLDHGGEFGAEQAGFPVALLGVRAFGHA